MVSRREGGKEGGGRRLEQSLTATRRRSWSWSFGESRPSLFRSPFHRRRIFQASAEPRLGGFEFSV